jgi:mercuric ion transport protein
MTDPTIQLLAFEGCPLADAARANLEQALSHCGISGYRTVDIFDPETPDELRGWGSPTILIDGIDVGGQHKGNGVGCRIYPGADKVPSVAEIAAKVRSVRGQA